MDHLHWIAFNHAVHTQYEHLSKLRYGSITHWLSVLTEAQSRRLMAWFNKIFNSESEAENEMIFLSLFFSSVQANASTENNPTFILRVNGALKLFRIAPR